MEEKKLLDLLIKKCHASSVLMEVENPISLIVSFSYSDFDLIN
jgi:hypothetical protein